MMKTTRYLDPSGEMTIHRRLSSLEVYDYIHSPKARLSMDDTFIQQIMLYKIQAERMSSKKGYVRCTIKINVSYKNLQDGRKLFGYPICPYGDIIFFIKAASEGTSDFLREDEETHFYTNRLGMPSGILRIRVKWDRELSRWNISTRPVTPSQIQPAGRVLIVPYESHYSSGADSGQQGIDSPRKSRPF